MRDKIPHLTKNDQLTDIKQNSSGFYLERDQLIQAKNII